MRFFSRREFLQQSLTYAAATSFLSDLKLFAEPFRSTPLSGHFFVVVKTLGGMDVTLGLDPYTLPEGADAQDLFLEYRPEEITKVDNIALAPAAKPLIPHASDCLIVNGVMMRRDAGHDVINQYMMTGRGDGKAANLPVELAMAMESTPFGVITNGQLYLAGKATNLSATQDILQQSSQLLLIDWIEERLKLLAEKEGTPYEEAEKEMVKGKDAAQKIQALLEVFQKDYGKLNATHAIAASLASGGSRFVQYDLPLQVQLDTHSNFEKVHLQEQTLIWTQVADLFALFKKVPYKEGSLFDATTFMVISEFSRTPYLNPAKGKDHNPYTNSVLFAGKGIQKGKVVGKSRLITRKQTKTQAEHIAWPYNYKEQKLADSPEGASFIYPENIIKAVGQIFGNPKGFHPVADSVPILTGIAK